jgi:hypothetical protein
MYVIPLFLIVTYDHLSSMEITRGYIVYGYEREDVFGLEVSKLVVHDAQGTII